MYTSKIALCSVLFLTTAFAQADNLISNGGFESGKLIANYEPSAMLVKRDESAIPDWTIVGPSGASIMWIENGNLFQPPIFGDRYLDLTGTTFNPAGFGVSQTINTVAGLNYTLGFDIGNSTSIGDGLSSSIRAIVGSNAQIFTNPGNDGVNSWQHFTFDFTATSNNTDISLVTANGGHYIGLDNVSVMAAVPEPETYAMLLGGLALIGFLSRRKSANKV